MKCSNCGIELEENAIFCQNCGNSVIETQDDMQEENNNSNKNKVIFIILLIIVVLVIVGLCIYKLLLSKDKNDNTSSNSNITNSNELISNSNEIISNSNSNEVVTSNVAQNSNTTSNVVTSNVTPNTSNVTNNFVNQIIETDSGVTVRYNGYLLSIPNSYKVSSINPTIQLVGKNNKDLAVITIDNASYDMIKGSPRAIEEYVKQRELISNNIKVSNYSGVEFVTAEINSSGNMMILGYSKIDNNHVLGIMVANTSYELDYSQFETFALMIKNIKRA